MKFKKEISLEVIKGDHTYKFSMPEDAPLGEVYDVCFQMLRAAAQLAVSTIDKVQAQAQAELNKQEGV